MLNSIIKINEATTSERDIDTKISMMTLDEYFEWQNKEDKHHGSAYETNLRDLNRNYDLQLYANLNRDQYYVYTSNKLVLFLTHDRICHAIFDIKSKTLFYKREFSLKRDNTISIGSMYNYSESVNIDIKNRELVKYMNPVMKQFLSNDYEQQYPIVLNHKLFKGERFTVRMEKSKSEEKMNTGATMVVINELNQIVAMASNEWGATLLRVAKEYEGFGIAMYLGKIWTNANPNYTSGGYTYSGEKAAKRLWANAVRNSLSKGIYSELVKQGKITIEKVKEIVNSAKEIQPSTYPSISKQEKEKPQRKMSVIFDTHVILYDTVLFTDEIDQDDYDDFIYAYGFFRENAYGEVFIYAFDYVDEECRKKLLYCMLQQAKDDGDTIFVGIEGESDIGDYNLPNIKVDEIDGKTSIALIKDLIDISVAQRHTRSMVKKYDQYGERLTLIGEAASYKWDSDGDIGHSNLR